MDKRKSPVSECCNVHLHGWDAAGGFWHGPNPLLRAGSRASTSKIVNARGSFHGKLRCSVPGLPCLEFYTTIDDLMDIGVGVVHLEGAQGGPVGVMAVIPAARRESLRTEFAFEFVTLLSFFAGPSKSGTELAVHDYIDEVVRTGAPGTHIFAIETAELSPDVSIVLSRHFEQMAAAIVDWLAINDSVAELAFEDEVPGECLQAGFTGTGLERFYAAACAAGI